LRVELSAEEAGGFAEGAGSSVDTRRLAYIPEYRVYNREREIERQERERKERQWEEELNTAMKGAEERLKYIYFIPRQFYRQYIAVFRLIIGWLSQLSQSSRDSIDIAIVISMAL